VVQVAAGNLACHVEKNLVELKFVGVLAGTACKSRRYGRTCTKYGDNWHRAAVEGAVGGGPCLKLSRPFPRLSVGMLIATIITIEVPRSHDTLCGLVKLTG